jgi:translation initiation factor eIF-2B subunit delta
VVLTFGRSSVVEAALLEAKRKGSRFEVIVVDAQPLCEGACLPCRVSVLG